MLNDNKFDGLAKAFVEGITGIKTNKKSRVVHFVQAVCEALPQVCLLLQMFYRCCRLRIVIFGEGLVVDPFAFFLGASLILHVSESAFYCVMAGFIVHRKNRGGVRPMLSFAGLPDSEAQSLDLPPPTAASTS
jgi:hypothetical protein